MADASIEITSGTGTTVDTRTESTNGNHRQVIIIGDPSTNAGVAPVDATNGLSVTLTTALPAGTAAIGKLAANSGVDIGDVDITSIAAGDNNIGNVDVVTLPALAAGTNNIGDVDVLSVVPGTGATNLGKAIDTATGATDTGVLALATRDDALSALTPIEGDNVQLRTDSTGALWVKPSGTVTVDGSGVTQPISNAGITTIAGAVSGTEMQVDVLTMPTTTVQANNLDIRDLSSASDTVTVHGDVGVIDQLDLTNSNPAAVAIVDANGDQITSFGGGTQYTEDAAAAANPVGTALMLVREDGRAGSLTTTDGDNVAARGNNKGELYVKTTDSDALLTTIDADTSNISTKIDTLAGAVSGTEVQVDVLTMPTVTVNAHAVTNAGTFAVQVDGAALTSLQLIDDTIATDGSTTPTKGVLIAGQDGTNAQTIKTDTSGELQVDVLTMPTVAVTQSGTWDEVGINDSGNSITVDYATTGSGTATGALRVELPTNGTGVIATVGAVTAITNALPAGTNAIGKLAANSGVDIGDVTLTAGTAAVGSILPPDTDVTAHTNYARKYYTNAGAVTDGIVWSPAAGKRWHVVTMYIQTSAAATITLEDDKAGGDDPVWKGEIAANSGVTLSFTEHYPMASGEDAADLLVTTSAGNIYISCVGYEV